MTARISDLHIAREDKLPTPQTLHEELPCSEEQAAMIAASRDAVRRILRGETTDCFSLTQKRYGSKMEP